MTVTRRQVLGEGLALGAVAALPVGCAAEDSGFLEPEATRVQTTGPLEETAGWLADVPRGDVASGLVARVNGGLTAKELYEASFLFSLRYGTQASLNHESLHYGAMRTLAGDDVRTMAGYVIQARDRAYDGLQWTLDNVSIREIGDPEPQSGDASPGAFAAAVQTLDYAVAERAAVALFREAGRDGVLELLWEHALANFHDIAHTQIATAEYVAALDSMGWEHAEAAVRGLVRRMLHRNGSSAEFAGSRDYSLDATEPPAGWLDAPRTQDALPLLAELRELSPEQAVELVLRELGRTSPETIWDAVVLHAAEAVPTGGPTQDGFNVHRFTGANALRSGYLKVTSESLKLRQLLQGAAYVRAFEVRPLEAEPYSLDELQPASEQLPDARALFDIIGPGDLNAQSDPASKLHPDVAAQREAAAALYAYLESDAGNVDAYRTALADNLLHKADNAHHFKFHHALFLESRRVDAALANRLLAVGAFYINGSEKPDLETYERTRLALQGLV